jgi:hypothetical protein
VTPPECAEKISCVSVFDAARAWAERQFRRGMLAHPGTEVLARCETDPTRASTYQLKITIANAPAFRASLVGIAYEGANSSGKEGGRG